MNELQIVKEYFDNKISVRYKKGVYKKDFNDFVDNMIYKRQILYRGYIINTQYESEIGGYVGYIENFKDIYEDLYVPCGNYKNNKLYGNFLQTINIYACLSRFYRIKFNITYPYEFEYCVFLSSEFIESELMKIVDSITRKRWNYEEVIFESYIRDQPVPEFTPCK